MQLATKYEKQENLKAWWVSEKLDGVRAWWDGKQLRSRQGNVFASPEWFTQDFPSVTLDGELWMERGKFEELSAAVRRQNPLDAQWQRIRFMVFDLPQAKRLTFDERLQQLQTLLQPSPSAYIALIEQYKVKNHTALLRQLDEVIAQGGEGLMLHRGNSLHQPGRSPALRKLKKFDDAEAVVLAHIPGKGKFAGMTGALQVRSLENHKTFQLGNGLSGAQRTRPPAVGSIVTFRYQGLTRNGSPRFARFVRVRSDWPPQTTPRQ